MAMVNVVIGKNGKVTTATVTGKFAGTPTGACVEKAVKTASFPPSDGSEHAVPVPAQVGARRTPASADHREDEPLARLAAAFDDWGLNVRLPLTAADFDAACAPVPPELRLARCCPARARRVIVGSGGPTFFERFEQSPEAADGWPNPLDRFTARVVGALAAAALAPLGIAPRAPLSRSPGARR